MQCVEYSSSPRDSARADSESDSAPITAQLANNALFERLVMGTSDCQYVPVQRTSCRERPLKHCLPSCVAPRRVAQQPL
jgi:hypothetical protein